MRCARTGWVLVVVSGLVHFVQAQEQRRSEVDPAAWVPADALVYVGITDTARFSADFKKTTEYKMAMDKEYAAAAGAANVLGTFTQKLKERLAQALGVPAEELKNPLAGPLALYLTAPRGAGLDDLEPGLIAGVGDMDLMERHVAAVVKRLKEGAGSYESVSASGQTIHSFTAKDAGAGGGDESKGAEEDFPEGGAGMGPGGIAQAMEQALDELFSPAGLPPKLAICLAQGRLIVAGSVDHVKSVLARERQGESLAESEDHRALLRELKPTGELRLLVNLPRLFEMARASREAGDDLRRWLTIVGAGSLRSAVGHLRVGTKSYDGKFELLFLMSGERSGLARLLSVDNRPVTPPSSVADTTGIYASFNVNPARLLDEIARMIRQQDAAAADAFQASLEQVPLGPQPVNLRKDLLEHLAEPLMLSAGFTRPYGAGSLRVLFTLGHRNREAVARFASLLPGLTPRDFRGAPGFENAQNKSAIAVSSDQLLLGTTPAVEAALASAGSAGLAEDATFKRAARLVPKEAWCVLYFDQRKLMEALLELTRKREELMGDPIMMPLLMGLQLAGIEFDDEVLARKTLEYSSAAMMTVATTTEGVQFTLVTLKPGGE